jgi:hypothetical protein
MNKTVGVYHVFPLNRSAMIDAIHADQMNFKCEEITDYHSMKDALSDVIVVFSPEFLPHGMSVEKIKEVIQDLNKTLIIVAYDVTQWWMDRKGTFYLQQRDNEETINEVIKILILELMVRESKHCFDSSKD